MFSPRMYNRYVDTVITQTNTAIPLSVADQVYKLLSLYSLFLLVEFITDLILRHYLEVTPETGNVLQEPHVTVDEDNLNCK